jgi:polar amino acid transport system substrate-binding protein
VTTFNEDQTFFQYMIAQGGMGRLEDFEIAGTLGFNDQYMGFSPVNPQSPRYAALFDRGIQALRESGRLKTILDSYGIADWQNAGE